jgi:hypothetical protein
MPYKTKYYPKNPSKYIGDPSNIICRSLWERKFCKYLDENQYVIRWASEELRIPYLCPIKKRMCFYYPDFLFEVKNENNEISTMLVEIKPKKQTIEPINKKRKSYAHDRIVYEINTMKWESAKKLCKTNGWTFKILTEEDLHIK